MLKNYTKSTASSPPSAIELKWAERVWHSEGLVWHTDGRDNGGTFCGVTNRFFPTEYKQLVAAYEAGNSALVSTLLTRFYLDQFLRPHLRRRYPTSPDSYLACLAEANLKVVSSNFVPSVAITLASSMGIMGGGISFVQDQLRFEEKLPAGELPDGTNYWVLRLKDSERLIASLNETSTDTLYNGWLRRDVPRRLFVTARDPLDTGLARYWKGYAARLQRVLIEVHDADAVDLIDQDSTSHAAKQVFESLLGMAGRIQSRMA